MQNIKHGITAVCIALCLISLSVILTLNFKLLYYMDVKLMDLPAQTGYTEEEIKENYNALIEYNSVFYQGELNFPTLPMSEHGRIHFEEVKNVFLFFEAILFPITLLGSIGMIWVLRKEDALYLKWASYLMIGIPSVLGLLIALNWERVFVLFHKLVFNNDYWIFDPAVDPVITILPDAFFMHCAILILLLVVLFSVGCMMKYKRKMMRYILLPLLLTVFGTLIGCKNKEAVYTDLEPYVGKYVAMVAEVSGYQISVEEAIGGAMVFKAASDGTVRLEMAEKRADGTWTVSDGTMIFEFANETSYGTIEGNTVIFDDLYGIDAVITFAREGTEAMDPSLYYPEKDLQVIGSWEAVSVEELVKEGVMTSMPGAETMADAFSITFTEDHMAEFTFMGEVIKDISWGYSLGDCYMRGGNYHLCAYPVEEEMLTVDIYNEDLWYTFHCKKSDKAAENETEHETETPSDEDVLDETVSDDTAADDTVSNGESGLPGKTEGYHLDGYTAEQVKEYFVDVVSGTEYSTGDGNAALVQKWVEPIYYKINGDATKEDLQVLEKLFTELNAIYGFPGIYPVSEGNLVNLTLTFYARDEFQADFGEFLNYEEADGAVQYWYSNDMNDIYDGRIGYRTDISQQVRNSVLLEEIVNGLGIQDTMLREDSITYQGYNEVQQLSEMDWLVIKLLYHPDIRCGMTTEECKQIIDTIYDEGL